MKIYRTIFYALLLLVLSIFLLFMVIEFFKIDWRLGFATLSASYIFNITVSIYSFSRNKRADSQIQFGWIILLLIPLVGGIFFLLFAHTWIWQRKKQKSTLLFKKELFEDRVRTNSEIEIIKNGDINFERLIYDLENAKKSIYIQSFIISAGIVFNKIESILIEKKMSGIDIIILTDYIGNLGTSDGKYKKLINSGIKFRVFNPVWKTLNSGNVNHRNHDKFIIIDNEIAYTGGLNIGDDYSHLYSKYGFWNDLHFRTKGEVVEQIISKFILNWYEATGEKLEINYENILIENKLETELLIDIPYTKKKEFLDKLIFMVNNAKKTLKFLTPYLIIPPKLMTALIEASSRGVVINIIITGIADKKTAYYFANYYSAKLSNYGIKIMRTNNFFMHAKAYIIDDDYSIIGSTNIDYRSLFHHYETNFVVKDKDFNIKMTNYFDNLASKTYLLEEKSSDWSSFKLFIWQFIKLISPIM